MCELARVHVYLSVRTKPLSTMTGTFCMGFNFVKSGVLFSPAHERSVKKSSNQTPIRNPAV